MTGRVSGQSWDRTPNNRVNITTRTRTRCLTARKALSLCQNHVCCIPVGGAKLRAHHQSASLCDETSSDTSYLSLRMLRLLLSAASVQGSDGTVRITMLSPARKRPPGRAVIEPGDEPRSKWEPERARAPVSRPEVQVVFLSHRSCSSQSANCRFSAFRSESRRRAALHHLR